MGSPHQVSSSWSCDGREQGEADEEDPGLGMERLKMRVQMWPEPQQEALELFSFCTCMCKQDPR